jgi:peptide/nickel transport system substrate-binding protein
MTKHTKAAALVVATGLFAAACTGEGAESPLGETGGDSAAESVGEAPMLAELVASGELEALEERLPADPLVVQPLDQVGVYGGTWETAIKGPGDETWLSRTIGYELLVRWVPEWTGAAGDEEIIPNVAKTYEVNPEGTEFTFTLREGMRWSDGEALTSEDIQFAYEDVVLNPDLTPAIPAVFLSGGEPAELEVIDEYTFAFRFAEPNGLFIPALAEPGLDLVRPKHYLSQFHADYTDDIDDVVSAEGFSTWAELWEAKQEWWSNVDLPVVHAWLLTSAIGDGTAVRAERNPYYWKVDTEGNQLPYLDSVRYQVISDEQTMLAAAMQGDFDMHTRHFTTSVNKPVLAGAREDGGFDFFDLVPGLANQLTIMLNLTHEDEALREVFANKDFRVGLSHAINRVELIDAVYQRQGTPSQVAPLPESAFYHERLSQQYVEYDIELANEYLDQAGYAERDSAGFRLGPDGSRISFSVEYASDMTSFGDWAGALELISGYWAEVGIEMRPDPMDRSLFEERRIANSHDAAVWAAGGGTDVIQNPFWYLPITDRADYAQLWAEFYTSAGASGLEPPEAVQRQWDLREQLTRAIDSDEQGRLMDEILDIAADEFFHIGIVQPASEYGIVADHFHNVPPVMPDSYRVQTPALTNPEQYFKSE